MNHNKHNLQIGDDAILDERSTIKIHAFTPNYMFATVSSNEVDTWEVMTLRLSPIIPDRI